MIYILIHIIILLAASLIFMGIKYFNYKTNNIQMKQALLQYKNELSLIKNYSVYKEILVDCREKAFSQAFCTLGIQLYDKETSYTDTNKKRILESFLSRLEELNGKELIQMLIENLYGGSIDAFTADNIRYFYESFHKSELYKSTIEAETNMFKK